jgi:hypothetical protein
LGKAFNYQEGSTSRYGLEPYEGRKTRHICPSCKDREKSFTKVIDLTTGKYVGEEFGVCSRFIKCGYKMFPSSGGKASLVSVSDIKEDYKSCINPIPSLIPPNHFIPTCLSSHKNNLGQFLISKFGKDKVKNAFNNYQVGIHDHWDKATVFWQISKDYAVRTGKVMDYDINTGKRIKKPYARINWMHSVLELGDFNLKQCYFGEHLLSLDLDEYHFAESEKTAIICHIKNPESAWIATGGLMNLTTEKLEPFQDKKIKLYPDKGAAYELWCKTIEDRGLNKLYNIEVINFLETKSQVKEGEDMADYILQL